MTFKRRSIIREFFTLVRRPAPVPLTDRPDDRMMELVRQLKSKDPAERKKAEFELNRDRERARPYLEMLLKERPDFEISLSAIRILGGIGGPVSAAVEPRIARSKK